MQCFHFAELKKYPKKIELLKYIAQSLFILPNSSYSLGQVRNCKYYIFGSV